MIIKIKEIEKLLFESDQSIYSIAKDIGVSRGTLNIYRTGQSDINNMSIKIAKKLQQYINDKMHNSWVKTLCIFICNLRIFNLTYLRTYAIM